MSLLIIIFGAVTLLAGMVIVINPEVVFGFLKRSLDKPGIQVLAVVLRLILGFLLIYQSSVSKFPLFIEILGWLSIVAAIFLALLGRRYFKKLMSWALSLSKPFARIGGIFAAGFGAFLVYAFV